MCYFQLHSLCQVPQCRNNAFGNDLHQMEHTLLAGRFVKSRVCQNATLGLADTGQPSKDLPHMPRNAATSANSSYVFLGLDQQGLLNELSTYLTNMQLKGPTKMPCHHPDDVFTPKSWKFDAQKLQWPMYCIQCQLWQKRPRCNQSMDKHVTIFSFPTIFLLPLLLVYQHCASCVKLCSLGCQARTGVPAFQIKITTASTLKGDSAIQDLIYFG